MTSKPKLNQPDVESTITSPTGESLNINFTIPSKQFEQVFEKDTNIEKRNITLEEVQKEWEDLGYEWKEDDYFISLKYYFDKYAGIKIIIEKHTKKFWKEEGHFEILAVDFVEHQLLTKTFKALGWEK